MIMAFELQILHASDLEGGVDGIDDAPNFAAVVDALRGRFANTITVSAGDNYIPGPFFAAAGDVSLSEVFNSTYNSFFGLPGDLDGDGTAEQFTDLGAAGGRVDASIMNFIGFDASAVGNHEFDLGPSTFAEVIAPDIGGETLADVGWLGTQFPYLSFNLDFSGEPALAGLFTDEILPTTAFQSTPLRRRQPGAGAAGRSHGAGLDQERRRHPCPDRRDRPVRAIRSPSAAGEPRFG
jgi:2',3'-cyclic-nucleotide 2'-phosphodiesterase (5'-nucleotidase family)